MTSSTFTHAIVLDFEATCEERSRIHNQEIIEFPSVLIELDTGREVDAFSSFVRPVHNPILTEFCTALTSITQYDVDQAPLFLDVFAAHQEWLSGHSIDHDHALMVTCGDWDLRVMLPAQCELVGIDVGDIPPVYTRWLNVKDVYRRTLLVKRSKGMKRMLEALGLKLEGRHHRGIDDCYNIAKIMKNLLLRGADFAPTNQIGSR